MAIISHVPPYSSISARPRSLALEAAWTRGKGFSRSLSAFTLAEVMIATIIATVALLGFLGTILRAYQVSTLSRHQDQARALLQSFADEFQRLEVTAGVEFFQTTAAPTGKGLTWTTQATVLDPDTGIYKKVDSVVMGDAAGLKIRLGRDLDSPELTIMRMVQDVNETDGALDINSSATNKAGKILVATFTATYPLNSRTYTESLTIARATTQ